MGFAILPPQSIKLNKLYQEDIMKKTAAVLCACLASPVMASNFSYTNIGIGIGKLTPKDNIVFLGEVYEEFAAVDLYGGYQFHDNVAVRFSSEGFGNSGPNTEISVSYGQLGFVFPYAVSEWLDVVPSLGLLRANVELCAGGLCVKDDDSGMAYGLALRAWAMPDVLELGASWEDSTLDDSEARFTLNGAFWFAEKHSVRLDLARSSEDQRVLLGYRYTWSR